MTNKYSFLLLALIGLGQAQAADTITQVLSQIAPQINAFLQSNREIPQQRTGSDFESAGDKELSLANTLENIDVPEDIDLGRSLIDFPLQEFAVNNLVLQALDHPHTAHLVKQGDEQRKEGSQKSKSVKKDVSGLVALMGDLVSSMNQERARTHPNVKEGGTPLVTQQKQSRRPLGKKGSGPMIVKKHIVVFDPSNNTKSEINVIQTSLEQPERTSYSTQQSQTAVSTSPMLKGGNRAKKDHGKEKQRPKKSKIFPWREVHHDQPNFETVSFDIPLEIISS